MRASATLRVVALCAFPVARGWAQRPTTEAQSDSDRSTVDVAFGLTFNGPKDVNQRPQCTKLALPCTTPKTFPDFGVVLQAAVAVGWHAAVVAEASTYENLWDTTAASGPPSPRENHAKALLAGPRLMTGLRRLTKTDTQGYRAFVQVLAGPEASTVVPTRFALQPGAGIEIPLPRPGFWFRGSGDYRWTRGGPRNLSTGRAMFSVVVAR
jgi:hypothetical protein